MYAFLSKVFGRKKDDRDVPSSSQPVLGPGELLGGRFEAVSANVSPSSQFLELEPNINEAKDKEREKDKDVGFSFFKGKWRPASPDVKPTRKLDILPHLSLNFQEPTKVEPATPNLGLLFTTDQILSDADIGQRRLNPLEALILVQACSRAIVARGLETLGIMHPHWYAASHKIQRRVISHFIYLANLESSTSTPSLASPTSPLSAFEAEVNDTFSPHDIAAILRWGLRHVQIEGTSFGTDDGWYKTFLESEIAAGYPPKAFSDKLAPLLPTAHLQLLTAALEIFSSLAAHAEVNGTSGSELCKLFGLWLLTAHRVEDNDDWKTFYARWERTGRMLEHLFLSRIRDQSTDQRMPIRLLELIHKYPYNQCLSSPTTDLSLLPRPPFTTRIHDALFVHIEIELPYGKRKPSSKLHPLSLLTDAFSTKVEGEYADLWVKITSASKNGDSSFLTNIFTDDTISLLSSVPDKPIGHEVKSPTFDLASSVSPHKPSCSGDDADKSAVFVPEHPKSTTELSPMSPLSPFSNGIGSDWAQFSASGFLEVNPSIIPLASTLLDTDIEKTTPPEAVTPLSRKSSKRSKAASPSSPRKSFDLHRSTSPEAKPEGIEEQKNIIKASEPRIIQLDDAFINFWSDSMLDPISANWPTFVICKFKSSLVPELTFGEKTIQWLLLEQVYTIRTPPVAPIVVVRPRPSSPISPSSSLTKRFSFWSISRTASSSSGTSQKGKKKDQELRVGEMGELLEEEPKSEGKELTLGVKSPIFRPRRSLDIAPKSTEAKKKSVVKPAEEPKIDEETAAVAAVATGIVVASAAVVITNELPTAQPSLVEAVTTKAKVDHSVDIPSVEAVSTEIAATETVAPSPEPTVKHDDVPLSTVGPDVVSSLEAKVETEPLKSEDLVEEMAIEPGVIVDEETEDRVEIEPSQAIQVVPASVTVDSDVAPITTEAMTEVGETAGVLVQQEPIVAPLVSEVAIPEPEVEIEAPTKQDITSTAGESPDVFTSEPETCYAIEGTPAAIDRSLLTESGSPDDENAINQPETMELQSEFEPRANEVEHIFSPVEDKTDVADGKTSDSAPILAATQQLPEVASQEIFQPQSTAILVTEDVLDKREEQVEIITSSTELEGFDTAENIDEAKDFVVKEAKHDFAPVPIPPEDPDINDLEPEVETEATAEPLPTSIEQDLPTTIEPELDTAHFDEPAAIAEGSPEIAHDANVTGGIEHQSKPEQETLTALSPSAQETGVDVVSSSKDALTAVVAHEVETEVEAETPGTDAATTTNELAAAEFSQTEQPVLPTYEGDSTKYVDEAAIVAVGLATVEEFSSVDTHEATPEAGNDAVESGTTLNIESQREHEVDVPLPLEPENSLIKSELVAEHQVETTSTATTNGVPIDVDAQPDPSLSETAPNAQQDIEVQTQVDDASNIKDEPIPKSDIVEAADTEDPFEDAPASSTKLSQDTVQTEPEIDFVAPAEEEPSAITPVAVENVLPKIEGEDTISQTPGETIPIPEDTTASATNVEDQIIAPVEDRSEHAAAVETPCTDELAEAILPPNVESLTPLVEPPYKSSDDEIVGDHAVSKVDVHVPETQDSGEAAIVPIMAAALVESELGRGTAEDMSASSQEPLVNPEPEERVTNEEAVHISSIGHETPEVDVPITVITQPELHPTNSTSEDQVSTLEVEEQQVLLSSTENLDAASIELNDSDDIIPLAAAEPGPEVVAAVVAPVLELQAQHSMEETTEEVHIVEAASEAEFTVLSEAVEPVEAQLEIPGAEESDHTAEVEPQIIPAIMEESLAQTEEDRPVLADPQDDTTLPKAVAEPLDTELVQIEDPAMVVESKPDTLHYTEASAVDQTSVLSTQTGDLTMEQLKRDAQIESIYPPVQEPAVSKESNPEKSSATVEDSNGRYEINNLSDEQVVGVERIEESLVLPAEVVQEPKVDEVGSEFDNVPVTITDELLATESHVIDHPIEGPQAEPEVRDNALDRPEILSQTDIMATDETAPPTQDCEVIEPSESAPVLLELPVEQPDILERAGSSITESSISAAETGAIQTSVTTEPFEDPKRSIETPDIEGISETHSQINLADEVLLETRDGLVPDLEVPVSSHTEVEKSVKTSTTEPSVADIESVISEPATVIPVVPTTEGDFTNHMNESVMVAVGLATAEDFSSTDKVVPEVAHEATPEAGNDTMESGTTLNIEPQRDYEDDVTISETEDTLPEIHSSLRNDPTPVPLPLEPEISLIKTELVAERQVETTSTATTDNVLIDVEIQPDPSLNETVPNAQQDIEIQTQVDDASNTKNEPIPKSDIVEAADTEGPLEDAPVSSTKQSQDTIEMEPEVDFVAPAEEEPSAIIQVAAENDLPKIECEGAISQSPGETIPIPEDAIASVANIEDQIIAPVEDRSEHAAAVETSCTDELAEVILPSNVEESPETLTPLVEPSYKSSDNEMVESHVIPKVDVHVPETQDFGEAAIVPIMAAALVESDLGRGTAEDMSTSSQELLVNPEPEERATHKEAVHISSIEQETPEVNVSITAETEPELHPTNSTSEDQVSPLEVEEQPELLSPESRDAANIELNDSDDIPLAAAEPGPEVVAAVVAPVLGTFELQAQHSLEETTEEVHIVEAADETEFTVPSEGQLGSAIEVLSTKSHLESAVEPVEAQLEIPGAEESDRTVEVEPQIIPEIMEESLAQTEEDRPVLADLQDDTTLSKAVHAESLDSELVSIEDPVIAVESKPDSLHHTEASAVDQNSVLSTQTEDPTTEQLKRDAQIESIYPPVQEPAVSKESNPEKSSATVEDSNGRYEINNLSDEQVVGVERIEENLVLPAEVVQEPEIDEVGSEFDIVPVTVTEDLSATESHVIDHPIEGPQAEPEAKDNAPDRPEILSQMDIMATDETAAPTRECDVIKPSESAPVFLELPVEQPDILEHTGSSIPESSISATETGAIQTNVTTEPFEDPNRSIETPEIEGISETHSQINLADVQVFPETKDSLVPDLEVPVSSHTEVEESVKTSTTEPSVADIASVISEPATVIPVMPTTEGDFTKHMNEAVMVAVGLATAEDFSSTDKVVPEVIHEATPEAGNDTVESGTTLNIEPQREHENDVTISETEDTLPDIHSSLRNDPTPVPLPLEPEISLIKTELVAERQVETTSTATTNTVPIDVEVLPDPSSSQTAPNAQQDIGVQTQVDDTSNTKNEPIPKSDITHHIEAADIEGPLEDVHASSAKQSNTVRLEPEIDFVAPAEEEPLAINQVAAAIPEGSPEIALNVNASGDIEHQSELEQEAFTVLSPSAQDTGVDVVSSSRAVVAHEVETEMEAETDAATTTNELSATEFPETEQPVVPTTEGDSTNHLNEAVIVAVGLAAAEKFSGMDRVVPEVTHEAAPEAGNDLVESGTTLNIESQREHEVDVAVAETEDTLPDIHSSLLNDPTPVSLPLEPEASLIKSELVAERQIETTSTATTNSVPIDLEVQPDPSSNLNETAPDAQKDIEVQTQVDDTSNIKDEPISNIETAEGRLEDVPASSAKQPQTTVQSEPDVDFVAPAEEEPSAITQVAAENLSPNIESEDAIYQSFGETIPLEDATASVANADDQITAPVDVRSEHVAVIENSCTDELVEVILPSNVEESPESLTPLVEPSYKSSDDEMVGDHVVSKVDVHVPETQDFGEAALVPIMAAALVESDLGRGIAEDISGPSQELPVNPETEEPVTHKEAVHISSIGHEIPEVNVPIIVETDPEARSTDSTSEDKVYTLEVEEQQVLLSPESHDAANIELNKDIVPAAAAEPGPEVVAAVVAPVLGTFEPQAQHSVEETTEEVHIVEAASETEIIVPNEESTVEPVKAQLEIPEAGESDRTFEVEPQIIPAIMEESPAQVEADRPVPADLQDDTTLSKADHAESLDTELVPIDDPAIVVESEPDTSHQVVPTPAIAVISQAPEIQEDRLDTTVIPEAEPDLPSRETEGSLSIKEGDAVQGSTAIDDTDDLLTSTISTAIAGEIIDEIPVVTNVISDESAVSAPLNEENYLQPFEPSADSNLQDSDVIVIEDSQNIIPSHELAESTVEEGALTDIYPSVNAAIPASVGETIDPNFEHIASDDINKPESEPSLSDEDTPPVNNLQDNISITTVASDTGPIHVDEMPLEVVKDKDDVAAEPSVIMVDPASEFSTNLGDCPQELNDVSDVADEQEQSAMESHLEVVDSVRSDLIDPIMSEPTAEPTTPVISSIQDRTAAETKVDSTEEVCQEASTIDQGNALSTQTEDPMTEQLKRDAQIENIDSAVQEPAVSEEEANPEKSSAIVEYSNGHSDINNLSDEQVVGVERIEESLVLPAEVVQEPRVEVGSEFDAEPATITDELLTTESSIIDHPIEGPQAEPEAKDKASDKLEILSQTDITTTDETATPTRDCEVIEPPKSAPVLLELPVEQPEILERTGTPVTGFSMIGNGHSTTTTQETTGTHGLEASSVNLEADGDNIQADPKVIEPIHPSYTSPATLESPSITN